MKKFLVCMTVFLISVMMPFTSFSKETLSDDEMSSTTAQEGVSIDFGGNVGVNSTSSNFAVFGNFVPQAQSWGDGDGTAVGGYNDAGGWMGTLTTMSATQSFIRLFTDMDIDVGTSGGVTKTFIHMPQILVHPANMDTVVKMGTTMDLAGTQTLGRSWMEQFAVTVNAHPDISASVPPALQALALSYAGTHNGYISIGNHATGGEGVEIGFGGTNFWSAVYGPSYEGLLVGIPNVAIHQSWGDLDGTTVGSYTGAGYIGSDAFIFNKFLMLLSGTATVDVGTSAGGTTAVVIGIPTIRILSSDIDQPIQLCDQKYMGYGGMGTVQSLGTMHTEGININPSGSLMVYAH